jgi:hypothetical protein
LNEGKINLQQAQSELFNYTKPSVGTWSTASTSSTTTPANTFTTTSWVALNTNF